MVIDDNTVNQEKKKSSKGKSFLKITFVVIVVFIVLSIVGMCNDDVKTEVAKKSKIDSIVIKSLNFLEYGMYRTDAIAQMQSRDWQMKATEVRAPDTSDQMNIYYFTTSNGSNVFNGEKVELVGLGFNQKDELSGIYLKYQFEECNSERTESLFLKMIGENGFEVLAGPIETYYLDQIMYQAWFQNAKNNICVTHDSGNLLEIAFYSKDYSNNLMNNFGGKKEFRKYLEKL
jgi:hypothetical protein